eukprot:scaffold64232_cov68-Phaeocystis_antarctica.AAC.4
MRRPERTGTTFASAHGALVKTYVGQRGRTSGGGSVAGALPPSDRVARRRAPTRSARLGAATPPPRHLARSRAQAHPSAVARQAGPSRPPPAAIRVRPPRRSLYKPPAPLRRGADARLRRTLRAGPRAAPRRACETAAPPRDAPALGAGQTGTSWPGGNQRLHSPPTAARPQPRPRVRPRPRYRHD